MINPSRSGRQGLQRLAGSFGLTPQGAGAKALHPETDEGSVFAYDGHADANAKPRQADDLACTDLGGFT